MTERLSGQAGGEVTVLTESLHVSTDTGRNHSHIDPGVFQQLCTLLDSSKTHLRCFEETGFSQHSLGLSPHHGLSSSHTQIFPREGNRGRACPVHTCLASQPGLH